MRRVGGAVFVERPDVRLYVDVRGHGPALVFAHPILGTHADSAWLDAVAPGCMIVAPDLRGRGASAPVRDVEQHTFTAHADDLAAILDHLGIADAIVSGTSF